MLNRIYLRLIRGCFRFFEKYFKVHITPVHYFSPIPTTYELDDSVYAKEFDPAGLELNIEEQLRFLKEVSSKYRHEFVPSQNLGLSLVDAYILYAMIREKRPTRVIEIGSGHSSLISLQALEANAKEGVDYTFTAIEPYPIPLLENIPNKKFTLIQKKAQDVPIEFFAGCDLLFIDSSHVCKIDSDVNYEMLQIVPKLKKGCLVHWHDIVLPFNYRKKWMEHGNMFFNESYLLHAFLLFNTAFKIIWASRFMQVKYATLLKECFPYLADEHYLTSFWALKRS